MITSEILSSLSKAGEGGKGLISQSCIRVVLCINRAYACFCGLNGMYRVLLMHEAVHILPHTPDLTSPRAPTGRKV